MTKSYDYHSIRPSTARLQSRSLEDQCWYHGKIKRVYAQGLLKADGDFLVRDSITNAGGYVLTGQWNGQAMHFEIHASPSSEQGVQMYHFEGEMFRSVVDLIEFYHAHRKKITLASGFILGRPVICTQRAYTLSQSDLLHACASEGLQIEIEATYAPFFGKQTDKPANPRYDRKLSQHAILNQAKKRLNGVEYKSEHDLAHLNAINNSQTLNTQNGIVSMANSRSVFYINHMDYGHAEPHESLKLNGRVVPTKDPPKISPPKSPIALPEDIDDYCEMDYSAMDELRVETPSSPTSASSALLSSPSSISKKRYSEILDSSMADIQSSFDMPEIKPISLNNNNPFRRSAHSLNHNLITPTSAEPYDDGSSKLPSYLDRTQSCQNLYGVRMKLNRSISGTSYGQAMESPVDPETSEFKRFPSIRIEPAPLLPTRSNTNLSAVMTPTTPCIKETSVDMDYDSIPKNKTNGIRHENNEESDYDRIRREGNRAEDSDYDALHKNGITHKTNPKERGHTHGFAPTPSPKPTSFTPNGYTSKPPTAPKPTLARLKAQSQVNKGMRHLCSFLASNDPRKTALLISMGDCKVFELPNENAIHKSRNSISRLLHSDSVKFRDDVTFRSLVIEVAVSLSIQKSSHPSETIRVWIEVASHLYQAIGNNFAFGSVMEALRIELVRSNSVNTF